MSMDLFGNIEEEGIEEAKDSLGGGGAWDSDVYAFTITKAYVSFAQSGAMEFNLAAKNKEGREFRTRQYVTGGKDKGCKNYFERNGKKQFLPGYSIINAICRLTLGLKTGIRQLKMEEETVLVYDYEKREEVGKELPVAVDLIGEEIALGVLKVIEDKTKESGVDEKGKKVYLPTGETRELNEVDSVFSVADGRTLSETRAEAEEPAHLNAWKEKWVGKEKNKAKGLQGKQGGLSGLKGDSAPAAGKAAPALFGG